MPPATPKEITGYAARYGDEATIGGLFRETIAPNAFTKALAGKGDVVALLNHDPNQVLGRRSAGSLRLTSDTLGLRYEVPVDAEDELSTRVARWISRRKVIGSSFGFTVVAETWEKPSARGELPRRRLDQVDLYDVSAVTYPAYTATTAEARSGAATPVPGVPYLTSSRRGGDGDARALATARYLLEGKETAPCSLCRQQLPPARLEVRSGRIVEAVCERCSASATPARATRSAAPRKRLDTQTAVQAEAVRLARLPEVRAPRASPASVAIRKPTDPKTLQTAKGRGARVQAALLASKAAALAEPSRPATMKQPGSRK